MQARLRQLTCDDHEKRKLGNLAPTKWYEPASVRKSWSKGPGAQVTICARMLSENYSARALHAALHV